MPSVSRENSHRDSWPPTQVRLTRAPSKEEPRPLLDDIDDDPPTYFLTPAPGADGGEPEDETMDFDAGIESTSQPRDIVRSVSPSTLDGLRGKLRRRAPSPESDAGTMSPDEDDFLFDDADDDDDDDDDNEEYMRFSPGFLDVQRWRETGRFRPHSPAFGRSSNSSNSSNNTIFSSPGSFPPMTPQHYQQQQQQFRGRAPSRWGPPPSGSQGHRRAMSASYTTGRRATLTPPPRASRLWREPSPDVWSIEEETEEELVRSTVSGGISSVGVPVTSCTAGNGGEQVRVDAEAAKPTKRVRFVLPPMDE
jgi:hypothetical protein